MLVHKGYTYRIYPAKTQRESFASFFGCCRFVYNRFLDLRKQAWEAEHRTLSKYECMKQLTQLKKDPQVSWLSACDSMALQEAVKDLDRAYRNFFARRAGYPAFRSRRSPVQTYRTRNQANGIRIEGNHIVLPKVGKLKAKISRLPGGRILNATVTKTPSGKYFVSLCVEEDLPEYGNAGGMVGIDVGLKEFYSDSNGDVVEHPKTLARYTRRLRREQRKLSRRLEANTRGYAANRKPLFARPLEECSNYQKQRRKVALLHERIANTRSDFLYKQSRRLVNENQVIGVEDLRVRGMVKNHRLAKAISDSGWSSFFRILEYKALEHGSVVVKVPTFFPSSQTCHVCGYRNPLVKNLAVRSWACPQCGASHDRDVNAAQNILTKTMEMLAAT